MGGTWRKPVWPEPVNKGVERVGAEIQGGHDRGYNLTRLWESPEDSAFTPGVKRALEGL